MYITGRTSNRLSELKTLDINNPYKVGVNGVLNVQTDFIEYEIDDIYYKTFFNTTFQQGPKTSTKSPRTLKTYAEPNYDEKELIKKINITKKNLNYLIKKLKRFNILKELL